LDKVPPFSQAGAAFEDNFVSGSDGDNAQRFRDVIVLLDNGGAQSSVAEMVRRLDNRLLEIGVFK
jgi:hypothetical protein